MKKGILISLIVINTLLMLGFTFYLMKLPWLASDEKFLIWATTAISFSNREQPDPENFALINTSYDLHLIDRYDEFGFPVGNQAITDRQKLAELFRIINSGERKPAYTIVDIHFVDTSRYDSSLHSELLRSDNLILSAHINEYGELEKPLFDDINFGISDYLIGSAFDGVYKYQLIHADSLKLLPLKVYEAQENAKSRKVGPFVKIGSDWTLNNFIMNYRVLQKDIYDMEAGFNPVSLGELLFLPEDEIQAYLEGKIVVIGDFFENDMHETVLEITAGPLILLNAFRGITEHDTVVNIWFLFIISGGLGFLSYMAFAEGDFIEARINRIFNQKSARYLAGFASYLIMLTLLSVITFWLFNIHINVFFIALAFYLVDRLVQITIYRNH